MKGKNSALHNTLQTTEAALVKDQITPLFEI